MTTITIRLGERAEIVPAPLPSAVVRPRPHPARHRLSPLVTIPATAALVLLVQLGLESPRERTIDDPAPTSLAIAPGDLEAVTDARDSERTLRIATQAEVDRLRDALAAALDARRPDAVDDMAPAEAVDDATTIIATAAAVTAPDLAHRGLAALDITDPGLARPAHADAAMTDEVIRSLEGRVAWLEAALANENTHRRMQAALFADLDRRHGDLSETASHLAGLLETSVESRLAPVRLMLASVRMEGTALVRALAEAPGTGGPLVPVPTGAEALIPRLPTPAAVRLEAAMEGANRLQTLCRLVERIPAGQPVAASGTSSGFGRRIDPFTRQPAMHTGIDLNAPLGTPVTATAPGRIADVSRHAEYGLMVDVDHGFGIVSRYAHLSSAFVRRGDTIDAGNPVGLVGRTGRTTGDHLHYEVLLGGRPVDPTDFIKARRHVCETR